VKYILALFFACFVTQSVALPAKHEPIVARGAGSSLIGWEEFCKNDKYKQECAFDQDQPKRIVLTEEVWNTIVTINKRVNDTVTELTDPLHWPVGKILPGQDVVDLWDLAEDGYGDCEDHQLLKRHLLAELGIPRRAMRITLVLDIKKDRSGHAVLMIKTDRGDFILDNQTNDVLSWEETTANYDYVKQEGQDDPKGWVKLHPDESISATVASNRD
jgi:predicted transglutaminase-like cysteine proteinase